MTTKAITALPAVRALRADRKRQRPTGPADLARRLDPKFVVTPTIRLLSDIAVRAVEEPDCRDIVTTPPRTGKSRLLAVWEVVWALMRDPDLQIVLVSYSDELAQAHSREARQLINEHADYLGIRLSSDKTAVGRWRVEGHAGGLLATGIDKDHVNSLGWTALLEAIVLGDGGLRHVATLQALVDAGANVNLPDRNGMSPLHLAQGNGYREMAAILEQASAR